MDGSIILIFTAIRLLVPLILLRLPLIGVVLSIAADMADYPRLSPQTQSQHQTYQLWDKTLDTYLLAVAAVTVLAWKEKRVRNFALFIFGYRVVGVLLFEIFKARFLLMIFPNLFLNFFIFYVIYTKLEPNKPLFRSYSIATLIILALLIPKLTQEYFLHVRFSTPFEVMGMQDTIGFTLSRVLQWSAYFLLPALAMVWVVDVRASWRRIQLRVHRLFKLV